MARTEGTCPFCGSPELIPVIYGYAPFDLLIRARHGEVVLGGACIEDGQPQWKCAACGSFVPVEPADL